MQNILVSTEQKEKFYQLKSIHSKMDFWLSEFGIPYYYWYKFPLVDIQDVMIETNNTEDIEALNILMIELYAERNRGNSAKLFDLETRMGNFKQEANKKKNVALFKNQVLKTFESEYQTFINRNTNLTNQVKAFFNGAYNNYLNDRTEPDYRTSAWELPHLIALENGYRMAQFYSYVEGFKTDSFNAGLDLKDKILVLKYLGILDVIEKHRQQGLSMNMTGRLLSTLLEENQTNVEKAFRSIFIEENYLEKNIKRAIKFLEDLKLTNLANELRKKENFTE